MVRGTNDACPRVLKAKKMITITGKISLNKGEKITYDSPATAELPHIFPNFSALSVDFALYLQSVGADGSPVFDSEGKPVLERVATKAYTFSSEKLAEEDVQIQQTLDKLRDAVEKTIAKDLQSFNPDAVIKVEKNGKK